MGDNLPSRSFDEESTTSGSLPLGSLVENPASVLTQTRENARTFGSDESHELPASKPSLSSGFSTAPDDYFSRCQHDDPLRFGFVSKPDAISRINSEYFVLRTSGKIYRRSDNGQLNALSKQDFKTALGGRSVVEQNGKLRPAADVWLESLDRKEYASLQYCPGGIGLKPGCLNLFTGWGEIEPTSDNCSVVLDHIYQIIASGNQAKANFLLDWLADIQQNPTRKPGVCVALQGGQGIGKTVLGAIATRILGPNNVLTTSDKDRILGRFNSSVCNKLLIVGEEMLFANDLLTLDKLKHLITGSTIQTEFKFGDALEVASFHRLLLSSNYPHVFQAANDERRFVIYLVSDHRRGDADYFDALYAVADGRDDSTAAGFKGHLLERDLSKFKPWKGQQAFASDIALTGQKTFSLSPPLRWLREVMEACADQLQPSEKIEWRDGLPLVIVAPAPATIATVTTATKWPPKILRREAVAAFREWATKSRPYGASEFTGSEAKFWTEIKKVIPEKKTENKDSAGNRWVVFDLVDLRSNFEKFFKGEQI